MELGNSAIVPQDDGTYLHIPTGNIIDESGRVYDKAGQLIFDPTKDKNEQEES